MQQPFHRTLQVLAEPGLCVECAAKNAEGRTFADPTQAAVGYRTRWYDRRGYRPMWWGSNDPYYYDTLDYRWYDSGDFQDDDGGGFPNPLIRLEKPASGIYDIYVGRFKEGANPKAMLHITELEVKKVE